MELFKSDTYIEPYKEVLAYEAIWSLVKDPTFKQVAKELQKSSPSGIMGLLNDNAAIENARKKLQEVDITSFNILIKDTPSYPQKLLELQYQVEILYFRGNLDILSMPAVSVVGARSASSRGLKNAANIAGWLVEDGYAVISGLAEGIDTEAHKGAIKSDGQTIAVIGTPLDKVYPAKNKELQKLIEENYLLISQVPFLRYQMQDYRINRIFFPERNKTMAALSEATIIIEASDRSGTHTQARECLRLNKKLIILKSILENKELSWPKKYIAKGAHVVETYSDIRRLLTKG
jgi:DNA processing protein